MHVSGKCRVEDLIGIHCPKTPLNVYMQYWKDVELNHFVINRRKLKRVWPAYVATYPIFAVR
jgi:hypothetical protein